MKRFLVSAAIAAVCFTSAAVASSFTPEQQKEIGKISSQYLLDHPQVLIQASKKLQQQQMQAMQKKLITSVLANKDKLLNDKNTPTTTPANAKVAVIEFFDYQCAYCHKVFPAIEKTMKANPDVKYVFKEFPIFSGRWKASKYGAEMGLAIYKLDGFAKYMKYHDAIFSSGLMEGKLTSADVDKFATQAGADLTKAKALLNQEGSLVDATLKFGMSIGFQFTPVFVVMPIDGATVDNTTVIPGYTNVQALQDAINKAKGSGDTKPSQDADNS